MFNNRMLAVAAVLVMAVPALGAATPIVVPPVPEQLVEGHTVFTVIEIVRVTQTNEVRFAAAVAVLVREYQARNVAQRFPGVLWFNDQYLTNPYQSANDFAAFRYPCGGAVMAVNAGDPDPRVVMADITVRSTTVEDPITGTTTLPGVRTQQGDANQTYTYPPWNKPYPGTYTYENNETYSQGHDYAWIGADVGTTHVDPAAPFAGTNYTLWSDTVVGTIDSGSGLGAFPWDYRESYLITDPNDHSWIIDVYDFYTRYGASGSPTTAPGSVPPVSGAVTDTDIGEEVWGPDVAQGHPNRQPFTQTDPVTGQVYQGGNTAYGAPGSETDPATYTWPVWVVNMLGSPVFIPDYGTNGLRSGSSYIGENCVPFKDLIESVENTLSVAPLCGFNVPLGPGGEGNDTEITVNPLSGVPPWTDDPCMSYQEPSRNGFCYGGQTDIGTGCPHGSPGNDQKHYKYGIPNEPYRQYNALLYFHLDDLRVWDGTNKDHCNFDAALDTNGDLIADGGCDPSASRDTNGCSEEQYPWGPNPPQAAYDWPCPDDSTDGSVECDSALGRSDDCEGNSHPFHPLSPPHEEAEPCLPQFMGADPNGADGRRQNPSNHGGSSYVTPQSRTVTESDGHEWYQVFAPCDYLHTTRNIDIYFSPAGRPFPPPVRWFDVIDLEGSSAPFQDYHASYPGVP